MAAKILTRGASDRMEADDVAPENAKQELFEVGTYSYLLPCVTFAPEFSTFSHPLNPQNAKTEDPTRTARAHSKKTKVSHFRIDPLTPRINSEG